MSVFKFVKLLLIFEKGFVECEISRTPIHFNFFYSIVNAYEKIDRFYATNAYSEFQRINAKYISDICKQAFHYGRMGFKLIALIILVSPHYYKYYLKIRSTIGVWMKR